MQASAIGHRSAAALPEAAPPTDPASDPESDAEAKFTGWAQGNGTPVTRAACHIDAGTTTCYGLQADGTVLIATVSSNDAVTQFVAPTSAVPTRGCSERPSSASPPPNAALFVDPQGSYEIEVDRDWEASHGTIVAEVESWFVADPDDGFAPNVNVLTQAIPAMELEEYLDLSIAQGPALMSDFELVSVDVVEGTADELGVLEFTGSQNNRPLHFLATVAAHDLTAVVATFTAPLDTFDEIRCEVEPFLLTLRLTS